jgi:site-specific DNA-methyltransferase (adenine-specific)
MPLANAHRRETRLFVMIQKDLLPLACPINKLSLLPGNPRRGDVDAVKASLEKFGQRKPIVVRKSDQVVIAGNHTLQAAQALGWSEIAVVWVDDDDTMSKAFALADNRTAELGDYDEDALAALIGEVGALDPELLEATGWDSESVSELLDKMQTELPVDVDEVSDEVPAISKLGDVWLLGEHRVMCGDSIKIGEMNKLMLGKIANMVLTDPPYGVGYQSNMRTSSEKFDVLKNDDVILDIVPSIKQFSKGWVFVWTSWKVINKWIDALSEFEYPTNMIVWNKGGGGIGDLKKTFSSDYEIALVWHRGNELTGKRHGSVWDIGKDAASKYVHPTQKPVALGVQAIETTTNRKDIVLDLFGGSGSTLIAAHETSRVAYLMELDPHYVDVICARFQKHTGILPVLESDGLAHDFSADA